MTALLPPSGDVPTVPAVPAGTARAAPDDSDDPPLDAQALSVDVTTTAREGDGAAVLVAIHGELDVASVPHVAAQLHALAESGATISLDLSDVTFASSELVRMLISEPVGEIVAVSRAVDRVLALSGDIDLRPRPARGSPADGRQ